MDDKKKIARTIVMVVVMCVIVLSYYSYLSTKKVKEKENTTVTELEQLMELDLDNNYPETPVKTVELYSRMLTCIYEEKDISDKDLSKMVEQMRKMYASQFADDENNTKEKQLEELKTQLSVPKKDKTRITNYVVEESSQVDQEEINGQKAAMVECTYTICENTSDFTKTSQNYVLVNEDTKWKILGWQSSSKTPVTIKKNE